MEPDLPPPHGNRAELWRAKGDFERAIADYSEVIQLDKYVTVTYAYRIRVQTYQMLWREDEALADLDKAIEIYPEGTATLLDHEQIYEKRGERDMTIVDFRSVIRLQPNDPATLTGLKRLGPTP